GKAIQLHPLVCTAFNADFDGDQMAVHVPLSLEAQLEARVLMMSTNNILSPANGKPIIVPTQDIILGLYHLSMERDGEPGEGMVFRGVGEAKQALDQNIVSFNTKVKARWRWTNVEGVEEVTVYDTTPGRMVIGELLPQSNGMSYDEVNQVMTKKAITNLIDQVYRTCGQKETVIFADRLMTLGFTTATRSGVSFGKDDMVIPPEKAELVAAAQQEVEQYERQYQDGLITQGEKYNKVIDAWSTTGDKVAAAMMAGIQKLEEGKPINAVYMMAHSGARGSEAQIKQLAGMRGLMAKPSGEIIETPIISNFKEGLSVLEYFNSTHGARKGLADTALKTANSGYLTRRLVDVAQDSIVHMVDCGTKEGLDIRAVVEGGDVIEPLSERILGRTSAVDIVAPLTGDVLVKAGGLIDEALSVEIEDAGVDTVKLRSALTCESPIGICGNCYGRDLARGTTVNIGEAVGVIAAQSIGEPGTQLTMRTFHIGGAAQRGAEQSSVEAAHAGTIKVLNRNIVIDANGIPVVMGRNVELILVDEAGRERARHRLPYGSRILADEGVTVERGAKLAEWDPYMLPIISERDGIAHFVDLVDGVSIREVTDEETGIASRVVVDWRQQTRGADLKPLISLRDANGEPLELAAGIEARYFLSVDAVLNVAEGAAIRAGDVLARIPRESSKTRDITGGLPRVAELFEARRPKDHAVLAESTGRVEFGKDYKTKRRIIVRDMDDPDQTTEYMIPKGRHVAVREGDMIERGDMLLDGNPAPHDILHVLGVEALAEYLVHEIQSVYRLQGVKINDKHIEVIVRQMLQKVEISDPGETTFLIGELVDRTEFDEVNEKAAAENLKIAEATPVLQGITKASLQTKSWISAASFQETTRVLTDAATSGKIDTLNGLKENVIVGRLIPAGTGSVMNRVRRIAGERDTELSAERSAVQTTRRALPAPKPEVAAE
ncbi:MAG: DNA-directed RNA polymerase subunit beta', partial [Alphaproteobacteria bacterium]